MREYIFLIVPFTALIIAQISKFVIESIKMNKINWGRLINGSGGMPSSHVSFSSALTVTIGIFEGWNTPFFAIALVFTLIVAYDAMGVRMESGRQAEAINMIVEQIFRGQKVKENFDRLKEQIGHKPLEVLFGFIVGITTAFIYSYFYL